MRKLTEIIFCVFFLSFFNVNILMAQMFTKITTGEITEILGNSQGSSWADYDNDGLLDVLITNTSGFGTNKPNLLYHNEGGGQFTLVYSGSIWNDILSASCSSNWGDYDNDGRPDLFECVAFAKENRLYHNEGNGDFRLIASELQGDATSDASWVDFDNDGSLDMYITVQESGKNILYHNSGKGSFTRVDTGIIVSDNDCSESFSWADYDNDGDLDVFVSNLNFSAGSAVNRLYINQGKGYFTSTSSGAVILKDVANTAGASWGDYDNDGNLDLYVVNFQSINQLFHNKGDGTFEKIIIDPPEAAGGNSVGSTWGDFDNDGDLDLFVTCDRGFPNETSPSFRQNLLFLNEGNGQFTRITSGDIITDGGHTCTAADYDNDGDLDILIVNGSLGPPYVNYLYSNNGNTNNWITLTCQGTVSNKSAIGARVKAKANINGEDVWQLREIAQNTGCHSNNDPRVHFGLGTASVIDSLIVRWPSGSVDVYTDVTPNKFYTATEGATHLTTAANQFKTSLPVRLSLSQNYPNPFNPSTEIRYQISEVSNVSLKVYDVLGREVRTLVNRKQGPGTYEVRFDASGLASGVYFCRIKAGNFAKTMKLTVLK